MWFFSDWAQLTAFVCGVLVLVFTGISAHLQDRARAMQDSVAEEQRGRIQELLEDNGRAQQEIAAPDLRISMKSFSSRDQVALLAVKNHGVSPVERALLNVEGDEGFPYRHFQSRGLASGAEYVWDVGVFDPTGFPAEMARWLETQRAKVEAGQASLTFRVHCSYEWGGKKRTSLQHSLVLDRRVGARFYPGFPLKEKVADKE